MVIIMEDVNRLNRELIKKEKADSWLSEEVGKNPSTVFNRHSNVEQPDLDIFMEVATLLEIHEHKFINCNG